MLLSRVGCPVSFGYRREVGGREGLLVLGHSFIANLEANFKGVIGEIVYIHAWLPPTCHWFDFSSLNMEQSCVIRTSWGIMRYTQWHFLEQKKQWRWYWIKVSLFDLLQVDATSGQRMHSAPYLLQYYILTQLSLFQLVCTDRNGYDDIVEYFGNP